MTLGNWIMVLLLLTLCDLYPLRHYVLHELCKSTAVSLNIYILYQYYSALSQAGSSRHSVGEADEALVYPHSQPHLS